MNHVPDRPNYEHPDWCGEDMGLEEEFKQDEERCGQTEASCGCIRVKGHTGPHVCDCAGAWIGSGQDFDPVQLPSGSANILTPNAAEALGKDLT